MRRSGTVAYVAQQAWIQNLTVKENILFGKKLEPAYYEQVATVFFIKFKAIFISEMQRYVCFSSVIKLN